MTAEESTAGDYTVKIKVPESILGDCISIGEEVGTWNPYFERHPR